jgi:hypothetical protein
MDQNKKNLDLKRLENAAAVLPDSAGALKAALELAGKGRKIGLGGCVSAAEPGLPGAQRGRRRQ